MRIDRSWLLGAALFGLTLLVYAPALRCGFIWDDDTFLTENALIRAPDGLYRFWLTTEPPDYFPLTSTTLWLEWRLWGLDPTGYHAVNAFLHAISCVLLWRVLARLAIPGAWLAAAIFAVHPVNVESVAWITQRKNTLPMVFYLASLLAFLRFEDREPSARRARISYAVSLAAFLLALLAKTSVVMLPLVLLLQAGWRRGRVTFADVRRTLPFFALSALLGLVTVWYQTNSAIGDQIVRDDGFGSRLAIAGRAVWFYIYKAILPVDLSFVYPRWPTGVPGWRPWIPLALLVAAFAVLWHFRRGWARPLLFTATYFVLGLLPVLGFVDIYFMRYSLVADHYQYISSIAVAALAAAALTKFLDPRVRVPVAALIVSLLSVLTWQRQQVFRTPEVLWNDTLSKNPSSWMAHNNLGVDLHRRGHLAGAVERYREALRLDPDHAGVHYNLGDSLLGLKQFDEAAAQYGEALRLDPDYAEAHNNLANSLYAQGKLAEAAEHYEEALRLQPGYAEAHSNLGSLLQDLGRSAEAVVHHEQAVQLGPDIAAAHYNLGNALREVGRLEEAVVQYREALRLGPDLLGARYHLGDSLSALGRFEEAVAQYEEMLRAVPNDLGARQNIGDALQRSGRFQEALAHYDFALRLQPNDPYVLNAVAWLLATCPDPSLRNGRRAVELAELALARSGDREAVFLDALAAAHAELGDFAEAVRWQESAVERAAPAQKAESRRRLDLYRAGRSFLEGEGARTGG